MLSHEITNKAGKNKVRNRIGRGRGSSNGKTSGRGHKGQKSRAGYSQRPMYAGGSIPVFRRLPRVGFSNYNFLFCKRVGDQKAAMEARGQF